MNQTLSDLLIEYGIYDLRRISRSYVPSGSEETYILFIGLLWSRDYTAAKAFFSGHKEALEKQGLDRFCKLLIDAETEQNCLRSAFELVEYGRREHWSDFLSAQYYFNLGFAFSMSGFFGLSVHYFDSAISCYEKTAYRSLQWLSLFNRLLCSLHLDDGQQIDETNRILDRLFSALCPRSRLNLSKFFVWKQLYLGENESVIKHARGVLEEFKGTADSSKSLSEIQELLILAETRQARSWSGPAPLFFQLGRSQDESPVLVEQFEILSQSSISVHYFKKKMNLWQRTLNPIQYNIVVETLVATCLNKENYRMVAYITRQLLEEEARFLHIIRFSNFREYRILGLQALEHSESLSFLAQEYEKTAPPQKLKWLQERMTKPIHYSARPAFVIDFARSRATLGQVNLNFSRSPMKALLLDVLCENKNGLYAEDLANLIYPNDLDNDMKMDKLKSLIDRTSRVFSPYRPFVLRNKRYSINRVDFGLVVKRGRESYNTKAFVQVYDYLTRSSIVSVSRLTSDLNISRRTIQFILGNMVKQGTVERFGKGRNTKYLKKKR